MDGTRPKARPLLTESAHPDRNKPFHMGLGIRLIGAAAENESNRRCL